MPTPSHVATALNALTVNLPAYAQAEAFYEGTVEEVFASRRLRDLLRNTGDQFRINYARTPVDVLVERTLVQGITCSDASAQTLLDLIWEANELGLEAKDVHRRAYEYGDSYIIGWPDEDAEGGVSLYAHDPGSVRVFYDEAKPRVKSHAVHMWTETGTGDNFLGEGVWVRVNMYYPDYTEMWVSNTRIDDGAGQILYGFPDLDLVPFITDDAQDGTVVNETGVLPVFHFRTGRPYGRPEHADAYGPQQMINKLTVTMMAAVDYAGFPQRYVTTDSSLDPTPQQDAFTGDPVLAYDTQTDQPGLSDDSSLEAGPGSTWLLSGARVGVGQFAVADTNNFLDPIHSIIKQMASVCDTPGYYFDRSGQMPSGESFRMSENPLNKKTSDRLALFGVTWHEVFEYCLAVNGYAQGSDAQIAWAPPQVFTDLDSWKTAQVQLDAGVPFDQVLRERGYSEDLIEEWEKARAAEEARKERLAQEIAAGNGGEADSSADAGSADGNIGANA